MIRLSGVNVGYGDRTVLRDLSFNLSPGSFYFLSGPSGSGKSTLFKLMSAQLQPKRGQVELFGQDVTRVKPDEAARLRRRIGMVLQDNPMLNHLTAWENVAVPLIAMGKRKQDFQPDIDDLFEWVGLGEYRNAMPETLSGGQLQRVGIARAVIGKPELILADEPTSSVEPQMARRLLRLFIELNRLGSTIVIATHDAQLMRQHKAARLEITDGHVRII